MGKHAELQHFYISEEQSVYLLKQDDAQKLKQWLRLCEKQLYRVGYRQIRFIGKGMYGFVFAGIDSQGHPLVFKFSRITLPTHLQARLEEEAWILGKLNHSNIPGLIRYQQLKLQGIMVMELAPGRDLAQLSLKCGPLPINWTVAIAKQLAELLRYLRHDLAHPVVHGDIKPSNLVFDPIRHKLSLIDWGSAVFAQLDASGEPIANHGLGVGAEPLASNARMGDLYFIGYEQLQGQRSSPRFDEQGVAATLYALACGAPSRFSHQAIPAASLGLPKPLADTLDAMLSKDIQSQHQAGQHFINELTKHPWHPITAQAPATTSSLPIWVHQYGMAIDTVAYSSRRSFLKQHQQPTPYAALQDRQADRYYRDDLIGMGDTEKAFVIAVSRLGEFPVLGGLALHWHNFGVAIDSSLNLFDPTLKGPFTHAVNNLVKLAQALPHNGIFKACFFNARSTLHLERENASVAFEVPQGLSLDFEMAPTPEMENKSRLHSYFEDGDDPDESLKLPQPILDELAKLNDIHHTGCIIFEVLETHLKLHNYLRLLNTDREADFQQCLDRIVGHIPKIRGLGVSGFMKLPYKNTRHFAFKAQQDKCYLTPPKRRLQLTKGPK